MELDREEREKKEDKRGSSPPQILEEETIERTQRVDKTKLTILNNLMFKFLLTRNWSRSFSCKGSISPRTTIGNHGKAKSGKIYLIYFK